MYRVRYSLLFLCIGLFGLQTILLKDVWASQPNIVLSRALHFNAPDGHHITLEPGKYFVEPAGDSELRLMRDGQQKEVIVLQAQALTHEQYELFSPMAMTRPSKHDSFFITLLLPGGQKLEAVGSTKAPSRSTRPSIAKKQQTAPEVLEPKTITEVSTPPAVENALPPVTKPIPFSETPQVPSAPALPYQAPTPDSQLTPDIVSLPQDGSHSIFVYAPDHVGHTIHEQPRLYWYLSESTDQSIDVLLTEQGEVEVVFDMRLLPPMEAGIHHIALEDYGIRLLEDVAYRWEVKLLSGESQKIVKASGFIKRVGNAFSLPTTMNRQAPSPDAPRLYAQSGLWYDAFWALSELIRSEPQNPLLFEQRASLLEQVGLENLANLDRTTIAAN